jgi:hypothetical protein
VVARLNEATARVAALDRELAARKAQLTAAKTPAPAGPADFVRSWLVLGPFPNVNKKGGTTAFPPETEPRVDPNKSYAGLGGPVRWKAHASPLDYVDLANVFNNQPARRELGMYGPAVAYAACWVRSDRARPALLSLGSNDGIKVWVNRRPVADRRVERAAQPGQDRAACELAAGWNELLVKVDNQGGGWGFYLDLREPGGAPLRGLEYRTTPP